MPLWLPTLSVIVLTALALTAVGAPVTTMRGRRNWMASILLFGCLAVAATVWLERRQTEDTAALAGTSAAPMVPPAAFNAPSTADLTRRIKELEGHVKELEAARNARFIRQSAAEDLASYLRQFGSRRVILSCIPNDLEAYQYANQLVNILKAATWEAQGPQLTRIFGDVRSPGINVYMNADNHSDTVKILMDAFEKFNVPYQSRVSLSGAIPDTDTVELFIGTQGHQANASDD